MGDKKYKINLEDKWEEEFDNDPIIKKLVQDAKNAKSIPKEKLIKNKEQYNKFKIAYKLLHISFPIDNDKCLFRATITRGGRIGTLKLRTRPVDVLDMKAFKYALSLSDSLEVEGRLDGFIDINLTFFNMAIEDRPEGVV